jgi:uncharacterized protein YkwD
MKNVLTILVLFLIQVVFGQDSIVNPYKPIEKIEIVNPTDSYLDSSFAFSKKDMDKNSTEKEFLNLLNEYRKFYGLDPVVLDSELSKAAEIQAKYQAENQTVSHYNMNKQYEFPSDRIKSVGADDFTRVKEICVEVQKMIAFHRGRSISQESLDRWVYSPRHNEAMLWKDAKKVGISFVQSEKIKSKVYATVVFL